MHLHSICEYIVNSYSVDIQFKIAKTRNRRMTFLIYFIKNVILLFLDCQMHTMFKNSSTLYFTVKKCY